MEALIAPLQRRLLETLIADPKISVKLLENADDKEKYKICTIEDCGAVTFGKTPFRWWNQLLNCQDVLQFESVALKIWDVLVDCSSGLNNQAILKGLSQEIVMNSVRKKNYNWVIDRLFDCWRHVAQLSDGYQKPVAPEGALANDQDGNKVLIEHSGPSQIVIQLENGTQRVIPILDSVGDSLRIGLEYGITGVRRIRQSADSQCVPAGYKLINPSTNVYVFKTIEDLLNIQLPQKRRMRASTSEVVPLNIRESIQRTR